jgi:hypothetical protein
LHRLNYGGAEEEKERTSIVNICLGESLRLQSCSWEGSYADGYASKADLLAAVRKDIRTRLLPEHRKYASEIIPLLQLCSNPSRLFSFDRLARLFVVQIAPTQVMMTASSACYFSPARLEGFGLP